MGTSPSRSLRPRIAERDRSLRISQTDCLFQFNADDSWSFARCPAEGKNPLLEEFRSTGEPGLILLSSGSTGETKASLHSFARLMANYQKPRAAYRTLAFLLLDHIGGINTLFNILGNGGTVVSLRERTPEAICRGIERHRVQLLPTTPTFLRMLLISEAYKKFDLGSLELITYGTEPMPSATLEELHRVFPHARLKQTYGLTEVGILPSKSEGNDSLWLAVGGEGYQTKIVDGVLWIRTPSAMIGYLNAPSPFDEQGWFNTGDVVEQTRRFDPLFGPQVGNHQRRRGEGLSGRDGELYPAGGERQGSDRPRPAQPDHRQHHGGHRGAGPARGSGRPGGAGPRGLSAAAGPVQGSGAGRGRLQRALRRAVQKIRKLKARPADETRDKRQAW